jgi:hypothetical protein
LYVLADNGEIGQFLERRPIGNLEQQKDPKATATLGRFESLNAQLLVVRLGQWPIPQSGSSSALIQALLHDMVLASIRLASKKSSHVNA